MPTTTVCVVEGPHGAGKSTVLQYMNRHQEQIIYGEGVLDETFSWPLQSLGMETLWVANWFDRLGKLVRENKGGIIWTDRGPASAVFYTKNNAGALLTPMIKRLASEFTTTFDCEFKYVKIGAPLNVLKDRIAARMNEQRMSLSEGDSEQLKRCVCFYDSGEASDVHETAWSAEFSSTVPAKELASQMFAALSVQ